MLEEQLKGSASDLVVLSRVQASMVRIYNSLQAGTLDQTAYMAQLRTEIEHEKFCETHFAKKGMAEHAELCRKRRTAIEKEIAEAEEA